MKPARELTVIGFDFGTRHIGVAIGQTVTGTATALETIAARANKPDWNRISAVLQTWRPDLAVVGEPLNMDGTEQSMTHAARRFARQLHGRYGLAVELVDERLSSVEARARLAEVGRALAPDHPIAAAVLLEAWLGERALRARDQELQAGGAIPGAAGTRG